MARFNFRMPSLALGGVSDFFDRTMLLYIVFTAAMFCVFLITTFPYDIIVGRMLGMVQSSAAVIEVKTSEFAWHRGLALNGVRVSSLAGDVGAPYLEMNTLWVRPVLTELMRGNPYALALQADLYGGTADGTLSVKGETVAGSMNLSGASLGRYRTLTAQLEEGQVAGRVSGQLTFEAAGPSVEAAQASGELRLENGSIEKAKISGFGVPDLHFKETRLKFAMQGGRMEIEQFNATGDELNVNASGTVTFREPLDASVLNLKATMLPGKEAPDAIRGLVAMIPKPQGAKPDAPVRISGTLAKPRFR
jgi:type II secretion system protein N